MTSNLYKVGDWVYCEVSPHQPYVIRKIEELTKTTCGNVEAKVICAFRYQDIPASIMATVEKYQLRSNQEKEKEKEKEKQQQSATDSDSSETKPPIVSSSSAPTSVASTTITNSNSSSKTNETTTTTTTTVTTATATTTTTTVAATSNTGLEYEENEVSDLNELQRYNLKHRELYFSKYTDTIAATTIRAKCSVLLFNEEIERYSDFVTKEDSFFYHLTYDPYQKNIVADKGEIRVGLRYQADIPSLKILANGKLIEEDISLSQSQQQQEMHRNDRVLRSQLQKMSSSSGGAIKEPPLPEIPIAAQVEEDLLQWCSSISGGDTAAAAAIDSQVLNNKLTDQDIDKFLILAKSVGTYARALDCNNAFKQPSLPLSAASASRDITLFHAMNTLHENGYDIAKAAFSLITPNGPVICRDEMEDWSASEANLFEDALEKYGKEFQDIRKDFLPWKSLKSIIEYYYTWKTTDRYVQQKRNKLVEQESKLKQVYIPNHSKQNQSALIKSSHVQFFNQYDVHLKSSCESCGAPNTSTNQWYAYNPSTLVQMIMSGQTNNQNALANAAAQLIAANQQANSSSNSNNNNNNSNNHSIYQSRLCSECWIYWKKFSAFKYPNARHQMKNQVHKCSVLGCGREFKLKQLLVKHCGIAHGYFAKTNNPPGQNGQRAPPIRNRTAFYLYTTPMTKAARNVCVNTIKMRRLSRKPFKLIELVELNKEWSKQPRNISQILEEVNKKLNQINLLKREKKLDVKLIERIFKVRSKLLKKQQKSAAAAATAAANGIKKQSSKAVNGIIETNGTNGHNHNHQDDDDQELDYDDDDDDNSSNGLVIDNDNNEDSSSSSKPDYLKYFEKKCNEPCYVPERIAFVKPSAEQINKYHLNLMSQNRKRSHDQTQLGSANTASSTAPNQTTSDKLAAAATDKLNDSETSPLSKRSLLSNHVNNINNNNNGKAAAAAHLKGVSNNNNNNNNNNNTTAKQTQFKVAQSRSIMKPTQSINLLDAPEDIYYVATASLKTIRREISMSNLHKLARKPYKHVAKQHLSIYDTFDKIKKESLAKLKTDDLTNNNKLEAKATGEVVAPPPPPPPKTIDTDNDCEMIVDNEANSDQETKLSKDVNNIEDDAKSENNKPQVEEIVIEEDEEEANNNEKKKTKKQLNGDIVEIDGENGSATNGHENGGGEGDGEKLENGESGDDNKKVKVNASNNNNNSNNNSKEEVLIE